jgi:hypothetical protein
MPELLATLDIEGAIITIMASNAGRKGQRVWSGHGRFTKQNPTGTMTHRKRYALSARHRILRGRQQSSRWPSGENFAILRLVTLNLLRTRRRQSLISTPRG